MSQFNHTFLQAARGEKTAHTPVWFMRQAGRYMPEYRALRKNHSLLEIARTPELALEVTLQPLRRYKFDAAILFADILLPLTPMGIDFSFHKGEGPVIENPIRNTTDIDKLKVIDAEEGLAFVGKSVALLAHELKDRVPLIGFAGGPYTLASYMIEGGHSRNHEKTKSLMYNFESDWHRFLEKITQVTISYLSMQIKAGAQAIQLFDSWVGKLSPDDYQRYIFPHSSKILNAVKTRFPQTPRIHFGVDTAMLLSSMKEAGATVMGVDWQTPLSYARKVLGDDISLQGNLDPIALFAPEKLLREKVRLVLDQMKDRGGHIFNLGHGIIPETPLESVAIAIDEVHSYSAR